MDVDSRLSLPVESWLESAPAGAAAWAIAVIEPLCLSPEWGPVMVLFDSAAAPLVSAAVLFSGRPDRAESLGVPRAG